VKTLSIGEVARRTGVRTSALRYYEDAGILPKPDRHNGRRVYDTDTVRRIDVLRFAQRAGFTLGEIKILFHGFSTTTPLSARWQKLARSKLAELETLREQIEGMKTALELGLKCGCLRIEDCRLTAADADNPTASARQQGNCSC
jgi:MerR family transcriptional regulator, redox-sensitive transcriptional activator SoxR